MNTIPSSEQQILVILHLGTSSYWTELTGVWVTSDGLELTVLDKMTPFVKYLYEIPSYPANHQDSIEDDHRNKIGIVEGQSKTPANLINCLRNYKISKPFFHFIA